MTTRTFKPKSSVEPLPMLSHTTTTMPKSTPLPRFAVAVHKPATTILLTTLASDNTRRNACGKDLPSRTSSLSGRRIRYDAVDKAVGGFLCSQTCVFVAPAALSTSRGKSLRDTHGSRV